MASLTPLQRKALERAWFSQEQANGGDYAYIETNPHGDKGWNARQVNALIKKGFLSESNNIGGLMERWDAKCLVVLPAGFKALGKEPIDRSTTHDGNIHSLGLFD